MGQCWPLSGGESGGENGVGMEMEQVGKWLIVAGIALAVLGGVVLLASRVPFLGRLPGDILVQRDNFTFYFPLVTSILLSLVLTIVLNLVFRLWR